MKVIFTLVISFGMMVTTLMSMWNNIFIFGAALFLMINGATMATKFSGRLAESFRLSRYVVGFIIVAVISILPETFVAINASIAGVPAFGLATLFGSNVADLTLLFAIIVFVIGRGLKVEAKIIQSQVAYPFLLLLPLILGANGHFSRPEGAALLVAGVFFIIWRCEITLVGQQPIKPVAVSWVIFCCCC